MPSCGMSFYFDISSKSKNSSVAKIQVPFSKNQQLYYVDYEKTTLNVL